MLNLKSKKGEIGTAIMLIVLVLVSVIGLGYSNISSNKKLSQSTNTKAATTCPAGIPQTCGSGGSYCCDPAEGYGNGINSCTNKRYLEFACCAASYQRYQQVDDSGTYSYVISWYGCTGQPCRNTVVSSTAIGHLVGCGDLKPEYNQQRFPLKPGTNDVDFSSAEPTITPTTMINSPTPTPSSCFSTYQCAGCSLHLGWICFNDGTYCCPPGGGVTPSPTSGSGGGVWATATPIPVTNILTINPNITINPIIKTTPVVPTDTSTPTPIPVQTNVPVNVKKAKQSSDLVVKVDCTNTSLPPPLEKLCNDTNTGSDYNQKSTLITFDNNGKQITIPDGAQVTRKANNDTITIAYHPSIGASLSCMMTDTVTGAGAFAVLGCAIANAACPMGAFIGAMGGALGGVAGGFYLCGAW